MTQKVNPSPVRPAEAFKTAGAIALAGGIEEGYVTSQPSELSVQDGSIDETALDSFSESHTTSNLDVTISGGEAFIYGSWVATDEQTTVTLDADTTGQTVYLGWDKDASNGVIIGLESAFETTASNTDKKIPLYEFDTDSSGVTSVTEQRNIDKTEQTATLDVAKALGLPIYADPANANAKDGNIIFVDGSGSTESGIYSYNSSDGSYVRAGNTEESVQDIVATLLSGGTNISTSYDDTNDTLTINGFSGDHSDLTNIQSDQHHQRYTNEEAQDAVGDIISGSGNISVTYDDENNTINVDTSALDQEEVEDQVNSLLSTDSNITLSYNDSNDVLTIGLADTLSSFSIDSTKQYLQEWYSSGNKRGHIDSGGNIKIHGELTEGATL